MKRRVMDSSSLLSFHIRAKSQYDIKSVAKQSVLERGALLSFIVKARCTL